MEPDDGSPASASTIRRLRDFLAQTLGIRELTYVGAACFVLIFFAIPFAHVLEMGPFFPNVFGFALVLALARIPINRRAAFITIGICLAAYLTFELLVLANHSVELSNDFRAQWESAKIYAENGLHVPDRPQSQRGIPFYYPLIKIFGSSSNVYLAANVILTTLTYSMAVWIARRFFGWEAAAKTAIVLLFGLEPWLANTFPSHDTLGAFGVLLFLFLFVEIDVRIEADSRPRLGVVSVLAVLMSMTITWTDWQRGLGVFCSLGLLFYGIAAFVRRRPRWRLQMGLAVAVCVFSAIQSCGIQRAGLAADMQPNALTSPEMGLLVFGSDEGDGRFADWYRNARMANVLDNDLVASLSRFAAIDSLRENPRRKFRRYLERQERFLLTGVDEAWYVKIESPRWVDEKDLVKLWRWDMKWTRPIWWAIALLVGIAAIFRREVLFDVRAIPMIVIAMFMAVMGMLGEAQSRYALFFVFVWPIYAGSPYVRNPLPSLRDRLGPRKRIARGLARMAVAVIVVLAIPVILLKLSACVPRPELVDLHHSEFIVGKTPTSTARPGAPPWWKMTRNTVAINDAAIGSEEWTATISTSGYTRNDDSTLRFVVYNELGKSIDPWAGAEMPGTTELVARRALRVSVDGVLRKTVDLSNAFLPTAFAIPGIAEGEHAIKLEVDLGGEHRRTQFGAKGEKCIHRWTSAPGCFNTSIGYLGFY